MNIRQLQYFISVAEYLSFTEAAKSLYIAQSALSQQIIEMEKNLGVTLFQRSKRSVKLTCAGTVFLKDAIEIVDRYQQAVENMHRTGQGLIGNLRIGFLSDSLSTFLPPFIQKFISSYPSIELKMTGLNNGPLMEKLSENAFDLAFTVSIGMQYVPDVDCLPITHDYSSVILHKNHPLASDEKIDFSKFSRENFIIMHRQDSPQGYDSTVQICANNGFSPKIISQVHDIRDILLLVESGIGIAILPTHVGANYSPNLRCIPIEDGKYTVDLVAAWKKSNSNPSLPYFLDSLRSELKLVP